MNPSAVLTVSMVFSNLRISLASVGHVLMSLGSNGLTFMFPEA